MSTGQLLPLASYGIKVTPGSIMQPVAPNYPVTVRLTMAAIDPANPVDDKNVPSTLRIVKVRDDVFGRAEGDDEEDDDEEDDDEDDDDEDEEDDDDEDEEDDSDEELGIESLTENVLCTLSPSSGYQQPLDIIITPAEGVGFEVTGSYPIYLTGNYMDHPYDDSSDEYDSESDEDYDEDLINDEAEEDEDLEEDEDELDDLEVEEGNEEALQAKIRELVDNQAQEKPSKASKASKNKRVADAPAASEPIKKAKKADEKKVEFSKQLEKGPEATESKYPTKKLEGGAIIEDRVVGDGPKAKKGQTVGMRYIGKLKNGKVFDKNVSGKPFYFTLGKGEVIKGWDVGVAGMAVKGERRLVIPPSMAYGKQSLPGIPANSELTFDVKLVNIK